MTSLGFNNSKSTYKLPFYKTHSKRGIKLKQKWIWRIVIVAIIGIFFLCRPKNSTSRSLIPSQAPPNTPPNPNRELEVHFPPPSGQDDDKFYELVVAHDTQISATGKSSGKIPKIVHFIYGLRDPEPTIDLIHYIAIKSAHDVLKPEKIMFHYHHMPVGENFEKARPMLTFRKVDLISEVLGRPVTNYAHRADVLRLQVLEEFGGIYLDLDVVSLKPLDDLLDREFIMGQEGVGGSVGLCNAMIMARPHAPFLQRWMATYASFNDDDWNYHSVILPGKLAPYFPSEITVLNHSAFFWPLWDTNGLRTLYLEKSYDFSGNLGTHIWESAANKNLMKDLTEDVVLEVENSLYCAMRPFLLNGKEDPRPDSCRILTKTLRDDKLVGHWPLLEPSQPERKSTNPLPAEDSSGNNYAGIISNGRYDNDKHGVYLSGDKSYIFLGVPTETTAKTLTVSWWMKTTTKESDRMAMVVQTDQGRLIVKTHKLDDDTTALKVNTVKRGDNWEWTQIESLAVREAPYKINDGEYHHYALVVTELEGKRHDEPSLAFYMDGHVAASSNDWKFPEQEIGSIIHGVWFGSIEPLNDRYQDPWDNSVSLQATYRDIQIWERSSTADTIKDLYTSNRVPLVRKTKSTKKKSKAANTADSSNTENGRSENEESLEDEDIDDEDLLWADD